MSVHVIGTWLGLQISKPDDKHVNAKGKFPSAAYITAVQSRLFFFVALFVLVVYISFIMTNRTSKLKSKALAKAKADQPSITAVVQADCPPTEAFLEEARKEPKRILLMDFINTITILRDEKKFTFRAIAEWFAKRGVETDHSAVYRAYLASTPEHLRHPDQDWSDVEEPGYGDENVEVKKS